MNVTVSSDLPAPALHVWRLLQKSSTLAFLAKGMVRYQTEAKLPKFWKVGEVVNLRPKLFGILPANDHFVTFTEINSETFTARTSEHGGQIVEWNHAMTIEDRSDGRCRYVDSIEIDAGRFTSATVWFADMFYHHRHRRWLQLLRLRLL